MRSLTLFLLVFVTACGSPAPSVDPPRPWEIIDGFAAAGLTVNDGGSEPLLRPEVQNSAPSCDGMRIEVDDQGHGIRVIVCGDSADAERVARYYTEIGEASPMFFSHVHHDGQLVMQGNGAIDADTWQRYITALPSS